MGGVKKSNRILQIFYPWFVFEFFEPVESGWPVKTNTTNTKLLP